MPFHLSQNLFNRFRLVSRKHSSSGFTLIELLVSALVGSIVVSALLTLVVNLLETDQQESIKSNIQQEMQAALDYISEDLQEAVYVYTGECIQGRADDSNTSENEFCPGIVNHDPNIENSIPVLAFWKLEPLPEKCRNSSGQLIGLCTDFGIANRTYSLVVYYLRKNQSDEIWQGQARINRYTLDQFQFSGNVPELTPGYVNPVEAGDNNFRIWPYATNPTGQLENQQPNRPNRPSAGENPPLVDFVDLTPNTPNTNTVNCPSADYLLTPNEATLNSKGFGGIRSFYACVRNNVVTPDQNPDVIVYLRGNTHGRQGGYGKNFLPVLQTQVQGRGVINKDPE